MQNTRIPFLAGRLSDAASRFIEAELREAGYSDLLPSHGDLLNALMMHKELSVLELTKLTHRSKSTVSALADKLVALGYIEKRRSTEDSRVMLLTLSDKGRAVDPVMHCISHKLAQRLTEGIEANEIAQTEAILERLLRRF